MYNKGQGLFLLMNRSFIMYLYDLYDCAHFSSLVEQRGQRSGGGGGGQQRRGNGAGSSR